MQSAYAEHAMSSDADTKLRFEHAGYTWEEIGRVGPWSPKQVVLIGTPIVQQRVREVDDWTPEDGGER